MKTAEKTKRKIEKLNQLLNNKTNMVITMQDNPDPDSIASAVALRKLANNIGDVSCSITSGGTIGRGENRALVHYLDLKLRSFDEIVFERFDLIAMVDTQPGTGNNSLPDSYIPDIVIDHHPFKRTTRCSKLFDIRSSCGATATIMLEYLIYATITPDTQLATALLYAIRSDTQDFGREASHADIEAVTYLFPIANKKMLGEIQRGNVERSYFQMLAVALQNAFIYDNCIIAGLGQIINPDMIAEVADLLIRDEEIICVICFGFYQNKMLLSVRTSEPDKRADKIIRQIVTRRGTGGGHHMFAGGQISLINETKSELTKLENIIKKKCLRVLGLHKSSEKKLINI